MSEPEQRGSFREVAAWLNQLLERHPQYDADGVLELRALFLSQLGRAPSSRVLDRNEASRAGGTARPEAALVLRELRESFMEREVGEISTELARLELGKLPDLRSAAQRLILDDELRASYDAIAQDRSIDAEMRRLLAGNVVLPWRERRRELAEFLTARQLGPKSGPKLRSKARKSAKHVSKHYPELDDLYGWWLRDVARLPRWNPLRRLFRAVRGWALNYLALLWLMATFVVLFAGGGIGHGIFLQLLKRLGVGAS
jgi:hypothetical protein